MGSQTIIFIVVNNFYLKKYHQILVSYFGFNNFFKKIKIKINYEKNMGEIKIGKVIWEMCDIFKF